MNEMVKIAVNALNEKKASDIRTIHIEKLTSMASYLVICNGTSSTQVRTLADICEYKLKEAGIAIHHREGTAESGWILLDYGDMIVSVYNKEARAFYDLERFWKDGVDIDIKELIDEE
ncbi:MAG: ribosome silencing factor [Clostridia bacterium]|nr:ribosome silencing factor [Clostridia bacterium]